MRFFHRRSRSKSVERSGRYKGSRRRSELKKAKQKSDNDSEGSELPTLDQFEIAVPSKSFASEGGNEIDAREDVENEDNRSTGDISSITSVSYRAGYYYLRNIKKKTPDVKKQSRGCLPTCTCASCMPCNCSWLSCCCCAEAKSELAATGASKNSSIAHQGHRERPPIRKSHSPGRRDMLHHSHSPYLHQHRQPPASPYRHPPPQPAPSSRPRSTSNRRYKMADCSKPDPSSPLIGGDGYPAINGNHSLFDELSEDEEYYGGGRRWQQQQQQPNQRGKNRTTTKAWLRGRMGGAPDYAGRERTSRGRARSRGRRSQRY